MDQIEEVLTRGVESIYPTKEAFEKLLQSGKRLKIYEGFDPTGIQLHIGHLTGLLKLSQFQKLGHEIIFLIGDGTGEAGDPSGKTRNREKYLTTEELRQNAKDYVLQASKIVQFEGKNPAVIKYNGDWLNKLTKTEILNIAGHFSLQQLEERDLYEERRKQGIEINFREFLYPLLQGYDSVALGVDLEIGGSDQMFNMLAGRKLVKEILGKEKFVLTTPLLTDSSGKKIGKSEGNVIALNSIPSDLFGMIMTLPDEVIGKCFEMITDVSMEQVKKINDELSKTDNPMPFKKKLAYEIVRMLNSKEDALKAQESFENTFQKKKSPMDTKEVKIKKGEYTVLNLVKEITKESSSVVRQLVKEGAIDIDQMSVRDINKVVSVNKEMILKRGKHQFYRVLPE